MTKQDQIKPRAIAGMIGPVAATIAMSFISVPGALSQSAGTLDMPEQIGQSSTDNVMIEEIAPANMRGVYIEEIAPLTAPSMTDITIAPIAPTGSSRSVTIMQTEGGRDLCDPSVPAWERQQANVDCGAIDKKFKPKIQPKTEMATDPLLTPSEGDAKDTFDNLGLGDDVPATVILQN